MRPLAVPSKKIGSPGATYLSAGVAVPTPDEHVISEESAFVTHSVTHGSVFVTAYARTTQFDVAEMSARAGGSGYGATVVTFVTTSTPFDHTTVQTKLEDERSVISSLVPHSFDSLLSVAFPEATLESTWICAT